MTGPGSSTFVVVDFFDYESQTTSLVSGTWLNPLLSYYYKLGKKLYWLLTFCIHIRTRNWANWLTYKQHIFIWYYLHKKSNKVGGHSSKGFIILFSLSVCSFTRQQTSLGFRVHFQNHCRRFPFKTFSHWRHHSWTQHGMCDDVCLASYLHAYIHTYIHTYIHRWTDRPTYLLSCLLTYQPLCLCPVSPLNMSFSCTILTFPLAYSINNFYRNDFFEGTAYLLIAGLTDSPEDYFA